MMEERAEEIRKEVRQQVINSVDYSREISDEEIFELIDKDLLEKARSNILSLNDRKRLRMQIFHSIRKLDILQQLVDDQSVTEIMINGTNNIFIEKDGAISRFDAAFESKEKLEDVVQQ
ncbi:MAG: CpaF family protein, partial [Butyrivibrio sp.]|nr:CpaF family protein [Butyrivibrio sp.]